MNLITRFFKILFWAIFHPKDLAFGIEDAMYAKRGRRYARSWKDKKSDAQPVSIASENRLRSYFDKNIEGNGIFKFLHYFDIYERHFNKFVGKEVHIVEVGVYSGGSLKMWENYFGDKCKVYGIDIMDECKNYESENIKIFIGDQESRSFWKDFKEHVPRVDILIDDGGHLVEQQIVTLEEILPAISPGGVYLCEDVAGNRMKLTAYMNGLQNELNSAASADTSGSVAFKTTAFQQQIFSIYQYPFVFVIEKQTEPVDRLSAVKKGTVWEPFLN
jgi:hypothetical protein